MQEILPIPATTEFFCLISSDLLSVCNVGGGFCIFGIEIGANLFGILLGQHRAAHHDFAVGLLLVQQGEWFPPCFLRWWSSAHLIQQAECRVSAPPVRPVRQGTSLPRSMYRKTVVFQDDLDDIFADVVDISMHSGKNDAFGIERLMGAVLQQVDRQEIVFDFFKA